MPQLNRNQLITIPLMTQFLWKNFFLKTDYWNSLETNILDLIQNKTGGTILRLKL